METARQLISALQNENAPESVSPQRLAGIYDALLSQQEKDREELLEKIDDAAQSGGGEVPADLAEKLDAIGQTSANALKKASDALTASSEAASSAGAAKTAADNATIAAGAAKTAADNATTAADNAAKKAGQALTELSSYSETTDGRIETLEDFRDTLEIPEIWTGTMAQYDALSAKSPTTIYLITE